MSVNFNLEAQLRTDMGRGASRRLRRQGLTLAIVYGAGKDSEAITLNHNEVIQHIEHEAFFSHILDLSIDGKSQKVVLRDMQRHPAKRQILHMDFLRVSGKEKIRMNVPLHFIGEEQSPGVKSSGGVVSHLLIEVEVACLPKDLPEYIEVDMSALELGDSVHLSDLKLPVDIELVELAHGEGHDGAVASIHAARKVVETEVEAEVGEAEGETSETETEAETRTEAEGE